MSATAIHFYPNLISAGKAWGLPLEWSPAKVLYTGILQPYLQILDQGGSDKYFNLLWYDNNYYHKSFKVQTPDKLGRVEQLFLAVFSSLVYIYLILPSSFVQNQWGD
jgi:hypothetical protein